MASVYGDILVHFPELVISLPYFSQEPKMGAGYERSSDIQYITCVRQAGPGRKLSDSVRADFGTISPVLKIKDNFVIWTETRLLVGYFMISADEVYRIVTEKDWTLEAGFYAYLLEKVVGNNGNEEEALPVKVGDF